MVFCINCGQELVDGAKFCAVCGKENVMQSHVDEKRKIVYDGEIHKCPNCGEVLDSFVANCSACGYELRNNKVSYSLSEFSFKIENAQTEEQRVQLIRHFPISNNKEDILEFMLLASTNMTEDLPDSIFLAWKVKFEQCYKKAELMLSDDVDFPKVQSVYIQTEKLINNRQKLLKKKKLTELTPIIPHLIIIVGWLISIIVLIILSGINVDEVGFNAYQLIFMLDFVAGVCFIPNVIKHESKIPTIVAIVGLIISIIVLIPLSGKNLDNVGFSAYQLLLIVDIICTVIILVRSFKKN